MSTMLVTGGTGVLGRHVVAELGKRGAEVRVLSRKTSPELPPGVTAVRGDLGTGEGIEAAVAGAATIVHCASNAGIGDSAADVAATRRLCGAARAAGAADGPHLVYVSIVGVDRMAYRYYRAKLAAEQVVEQSGLPWTVLRATQFHDLVAEYVMVACRSPIVPVPGGLRADPVAAPEVAARLAELATGDPRGRAPDMGGPRTLTLREAVETYLHVTGKRRLLTPVPLFGKVIADFRAGGNLLGEGIRGEQTFEQYLRDKVGGDRAGLPYPLRGR